MSRAHCRWHPDRVAQARGLCPSCYGKARAAGTLDQHPPTRNRERALAVAEDAAWIIACTCPCHTTSDHLTEHGCGRACPCGGLRPVADRLGIKLDALRKALRRARRYQAA